MQTPNPYLLFIPKVQFTKVRASSVQFVSVGVESGETREHISAEFLARWKKISKIMRKGFINKSKIACSRYGLPTSNRYIARPYPLYNRGASIFFERIHVSQLPPVPFMRLFFIFILLHYLLGQSETIPRASAARPTVSCLDVKKRFPSGVARDFASLNANLLLRNFPKSGLPTVNKKEYQQLRSLDQSNLGILCSSDAVTRSLDLQDVRLLRTLTRVNFDLKRGLFVDGSHELLDRFLVQARNIWPEFNDIEINSELRLFRSDLPLGLSSYPILISPLKPRLGGGCFVLIHAGHGPQLDAGLNIALSNAHSNGCHSMLFEMPWMGWKANRNPGQATLPDGSIFDFSPFPLHNAFAELESKLGVNLLSVFIQPVVDAVSQIKKDFPKSKIFMIGLSGGAWTTHMAAAVDPRIDWSMAVAGSDSIESAAHDYEQSHYLLSRLFGYSRIYVLAGSHNRPHIHVYNRNDSCCFKPKPYLASWQSAVMQLSDAMKVKSAYEVMIDESAPNHQIGPTAMKPFVEALRGSTP